MNPLLKKQRVLSFDNFNRWQTYIGLFLLGFAVAAAFIVPAMIYDGGVFTFYGDYNVQEIPFWFECHKAVRNGEIFWNWTSDLGVNFIGSYAYYMLGSPFFWFSLIFPTDCLATLMPILLCLKFAVSVMTSFAFLRLFTKRADTAVLGALMYAFCSQMVYSIFFFQYNEVYAFFPLMMYGLEVAVQKKKKGIFAIGVALCFLSNYYLFVAEVIFVVIYFCIRLFSGSWKEYISFKTILQLAVEVLLGCGIACFIVLPAIYVTMQIPRASWKIGGWGMLLYNKIQMYPNIIAAFFTPPDMPARPIFYPDIDTKWSSVACWLPLFSSTGVIAYIRHSRKKNWLQLLTVILITACFIPVCNSAFQLFSSSYYARWYFTLALMLSLSTVIALEKCSIREWRGAFFINLVITVIVTLPVGLIFKSGAKPLSEYFEKSQSSNWIGKVIDSISKLYSDSGLIKYPSKYWAYIAIIGVSLVLLFLLLFVITKKSKNFYRFGILFVCIITVIYGNVYIFFGKSCDDTVNGSNGNKSFIQQNIFDRNDFSLPDDGEPFVRVDTPKNNRENQGLMLGLSSIRFFHTVVPLSITQFYQSFDSTRTVRSEPDASHVWLRSFLSVKYLIDTKKSENIDMVGFEYIGKNADISIWENKNYIPIGFVYDKYFTLKSYNDVNAEYRDRLFLHAILLSDEQIDKYSHLYSEYTENDIYSVTSMENACADRRSNTVSDFEYSSKGFSGNITLEKETLVFFSVPYEDGWTAYVNGEKVNIEKVNVGFMAVDCRAGYNEIEFRFMPVGLKTGIIITPVCLVLLIIYIVIFAIIESKKKKKENCIKTVPAIMTKAKRNTLDEKIDFILKDEEIGDVE